MSDIVTRFAPSPTGFLHIGGARTALFNWLYARHHGGTMRLRIEDTDRRRSTDDAVAAIFAGLEWLGIDWDGGPVHQFARADRHREVAEALLAAGHAYRCYASADDLAAMREAARAEGRAASYDRRWRDRDPANAPEGVAPAVRIKLPIDGETRIDDLVQGDVTFRNADLDDFVILRADGTPTYMLSVVVDDHDMGVTHIIRGDDHLTNAARQALLYEALDWAPPRFAHVPLIHGPDGAKLSKRHGALGVEAYRDQGFLPEAVRNYLVRLGWSHGDADIMSLDDMTRWFDTDGIGRGAARFDLDKLQHINAHYLRAMDPDALIGALADLLPHLGDDAETFAPLFGDGWQADGFRRALPHLTERAKTLIEVLEGARYLIATRPLALEPQAAALLDTEARALLGRLHDRLGATDWTGDGPETAIRAFAADENLKLGKIAQPLRAALTGRKTSPGIFDVLASLGRDESLARIADQAASP